MVLNAGGSAAKKNLVLIDAGWFVGRNARHWSPRGGMRRAHNRHMLRSNPPAPYKFYYRCRQIVFNDFKYLEYRMKQMGVHPSFGNSDVVICYDGIAGRQKRGLLDQSYKGNRAVIEDGATYSAESYEIRDLRDDFTKWNINPMIPRNGWRGVYDADLEADDLIAEAVAQALENPTIRKIVVFSKDSDLNQILGWPSTSDQTLILSRIESEVSVSDVESSTGVSVDRYAEWKALCGDTSDNIMGIPSVGPKSAAALINEWNNLACIPTDLLTRHRVLKPIELSALMKKFREDEEMSMYRAKKDYGSVWESLEKTKREFVSVSEYNAIQQVIGPEYFEFVDYRPQLESNLKLIRLPFRPDIGLTWNPSEDSESESPTSETVPEASVSEPKLGQE
jgi:5'-3' exonuclease